MAIHLCFPMSPGCSALLLGPVQTRLCLTACLYWPLVTFMMTSVCVYIYIYVCMYIHIRNHTHTHTHIYTLKSTYMPCKQAAGAHGPFLVKVKTWAGPSGGLFPVTYQEYAVWREVEGTDMERYVKWAPMKSPNRAIEKLLRVYEVSIYCMCVCVIHEFMICFHVLSVSSGFSLSRITCIYTCTQMQV